MLDRKSRAVHVVGEDRLWVECVRKVDRLVIAHGARHRVPPRNGPHGSKHLLYERRTIVMTTGSDKYLLAELVYARLSRCSTGSHRRAHSLLVQTTGPYEVTTIGAPDRRFDLTSAQREGALVTTCWLKKGSQDEGSRGTRRLSVPAVRGLRSASHADRAVRHGCNRRADRSRAWRLWLRRSPRPVRQLSLQSWAARRDPTGVRPPSWLPPSRLLSSWRLLPLRANRCGGGNLLLRTVRTRPGSLSQPLQATSASPRHEPVGSTCRVQPV